MRNENPASAFLMESARIFSHVVWPISCPVCGRIGVHICEECLFGLIEFPPPAYFDGETPCFGATRYDPINRKIIHAMKYRHARCVAEMMGFAIAHSFDAPEADLIVPVPLHKRSERGYNQAAIMARAAGGVWNIPVAEVLQWKLDVPNQAKASSDERTLPDGAIIMKYDTDKSIRVFLVDDVYTTGNTMKSAKKAVEAAGCNVAGAMVWSIR